MRLIKWEDVSQEERILVFRSKEGHSLVNYDPRNETAESLRKLPSILRTSPQITVNEIATNLQSLEADRLFQLTYDHKDIFDSISSYVENDSKMQRGYRTFLPSEYEEIFEVRKFIFDVYILRRSNAVVEVETQL